MMDNIFTIETDEGWLLIYMDDILICAEMIEELCDQTKKVIKKLEANDLFCNLDKCTFEATEVGYLGIMVSEGKIRMEQTKVKGIADWPILTTVKQVRSFLRFGSFYRRFISYYANVSRPLNELI
jgi:hypothetical protein